MGILEVIGGFLIGLVGLGVMIFVHELGHLLAAKALKVKVETFSIGYGKKLVGFKRGDTTYQIAMLPFGGFTKFRGEHLFAKAIEENLDRVPHDSDSYYNEAPWKRILISLAGPFANLVFAILFFSLVNWAGYTEYTYGNRVVLQSDLEAVSTAAVNAYPADAAGLQSGDRIAAIDGQPIRNFNDLIRVLSVMPDKRVTMEVEKSDGRRVDIAITPRFNSENGSGLIGVSYDAETVISEMDDLVKRYNPWLQTGDRITAADGSAVSTRSDLIRVFKDKPGLVLMSVSRSGKQIDQVFFPHYANKTMALGLDFEQTPFRSPVYTLPQAVGKGFEDFGQNISAIVRFFGLMTRINPANSFIGPVKTSYFIGMATLRGFSKSFGLGCQYFIMLLCQLSVILAIMNLLPLPVLDGGFIVLWTVEWIRRKPFRPRFLYYFQVAGFFFILILGAFVIVKDFITW